MGGSLEVEGAQGTLVLSPAIDPPSHRAWHLSEDAGLTVEGRVEGGQEFIFERVTAQFSPAGAGPRDPATATLDVVPDQPAEPCDSGLWAPATAELTYDDGGGGVLYRAAGRYAITGQFNTLGAACHGASGAAQMDGAILVVSAADGPMP